MKDAFIQFRSEYPEFVYEDFHVVETSDEYRVTYLFRLKDLTFQPQITIMKYPSMSRVNNDYLNYLFFQYGLFDLMSYYKLTCSPKLIIKPMFINEEQCSFFKSVLYNGLGEYFYKNNINISYDDFLDIVVDSDCKYELPVFEDSYLGNVIPIGGGKDSIVSMELLRQYKDENMFFMLERNLYPKNEAGYQSIYQGGYDDSHILIFKNDLDLKILELNKQGFLNGHIPISACISMASFIMAYLTHRKYVVLSNEASANEGNFEGLNINHQYSKSYEYEEAFQKYSNKYLHPTIFYFSLLRGWNEYQILQEFLKHKEFLGIFRSCNRGTKENIWCNHCSKCLYVYIMLYPYLTDDEISLVFDQNMLDDKSLEEIFLDLILPERLKPFECVGTRLEINFALQEALRNKKEYPYLLNLYKEKYNVNEIDKNLLINYWNSENSIPKEYVLLFGDVNEK